MIYILAITDRNQLSRELADFFRTSYGAELRVLGIPHLAPDGVAHTFRRLVEWIETGARDSGGEPSLRNALAFVDLPGCDGLCQLNPLDGASAPWACVVGMLLLAFPEIHWVFLAAGESSPMPADELLSASGASPEAPGVPSLYNRAHVLTGPDDLPALMSIHDAQYAALFDPANLRNSIRESMRVPHDGMSAPYLPVRKEVAAAIDEEEPYSYLHAYTAYRFGFRSHAVSTFQMASALFGKVPPFRKETVSLLFEDFYLNFADRSANVHLSNLRDRDQAWLPGLRDAARRIFVSIGHRHPADRETRVANSAYIEELRQAGVQVSDLEKPLSGIFDLCSRSGLRQWLERFPDTGYVWPPDDSQAHEVKRTHSAPGRLLLVAERLVQRAERIRRVAQTVPEAIHAALLSLEAQEYLGHRTPTTSLEALAVKHQCEALAECMFYGVEYNIEVQSRLAEIDRDVRSIVMWFGPMTRSFSMLSAEIGIVSDITLTFRGHNQFDEEQICLARARDLHRRLWLVRNRRWAWIVYPVRAYVESLIGSLGRFLTALVAWILLLSLLYARYCPLPARPAGAKPEISPVLQAFADAVVSFFGAQPPHDVLVLASQGSGALTLALVAIIAGFVHLGIFVSYLYNSLARR